MVASWPLAPERQRAYARIVIEQMSDGCWSAWFADLPEFTSLGARPFDAVIGLFDIVGGSQFHTDEISQIDYACHDGHLEYRIPFRQLMRTPLPSVN